MLESRLARNKEEESLPAKLNQTSPAGLVIDDGRLVIGPLLQARFINRPSRFLVECHSDKHGTLTVFLPNPGRLQELLLPDATLYLVPDGADSPTRKTEFTLVAVERDQTPILLHTQWMNRVAHHLISTAQVPGLETATVVRSEVPVQRSRFDLLLRAGGQELYVEVKSVTLFGNGIAMFPDAVTSRGRRHLEHLAEMARNSTPTAVLFLVQTPAVSWFMPDYHTDLAFAKTLLEVRHQLRVLPLAIGWKVAGSELCLRPTVKLLEVPWTYLQREVADRGSYLLILELAQDQEIVVGGRGRICFTRGFYIYVGSAMQGLTARLARHLRRRKRFHWHIDYLRQAAQQVIALPIRSSNREECELARAATEIMAPAATGFGCSDCSCPTHLFRSSCNPLSDPAFHQLLQRFRMRVPG